MDRQRERRNSVSQTKSDVTKPFNITRYFVFGSFRVVDLICQKTRFFFEFRG